MVRRYQKGGEVSNGSKVVRRYQKGWEVSNGSKVVRRYQKDGRYQVKVR